MQTEVKLLEPMWHGGKQHKAGKVVALSHSDAVYLAGIKRVEIITAAEKKPLGKKAAPAADDAADEGAAD